MSKSPQPAVVVASANGTGYALDAGNMILEGRPVYVRTPEHINAHFLIRFIALTMIRLIQYRVLKFQDENTLNEDYWESGVTANRIKEALSSLSSRRFAGRVSPPYKAQPRYAADIEKHWVGPEFTSSSNVGITSF
jgi:hypothetical protein